MITREDIRELSQFQTRDGVECALSFYFQPQPPKDKSHREEAIFAKDLVRGALRELGKNSKNHEDARADLQRILELAENLHGNQARAKAVFACSSRKLWREFDLPPQLSGTQLFVNRRFHLKPVAVLLGAQPRLCVVLLDRQRARFFDLRVDSFEERPGMFRPLPRRGRSDGYAGYDAGHSERRVSDEALHHFKALAERLKEEAEQGVWEKLIVGCQNVAWREFEPNLHPYVHQRLLGRFSSDVASAVRERVRDQASLVLRHAMDDKRHKVLGEVLNQAKSHKHGTTGLRRVLRSLQLGEVQTLVMAENYSARAMECTNCGYLDSHLVPFCAVCGSATRQLSDVCEAMIPVAIRRDVEVLYIPPDPALDRVGNIAALLRFRADQPATRRSAAAG